MTLLVTLLALGAIVALHEFGHLLIARACKMRVDRYSIGFGPILFSFRVGETEYALSMLPFGGYVKIAGMNPHDGTTPDDPSSYQNRPAWQRFLVLAAGPATNYFMAFVLLVALNVVGIPRMSETPTLGQLQPGSPAALAGLKPDDLVLSVAGKPVQNFMEVRQAVMGSGGKALAMVVRRGGQELTFEVTPRPQGSGYIIGASPHLERSRLPFGKSVLSGARETVVMNLRILAGIADAIRGRGGVELGGTLAAVAETMQAAELGIAIFLLQVAGLSVAVALFNLLPVPALDGGRIVFVLVEMVRRRPVDQKFETAVHALGFLVLIGLMLFLTVGDVRKRLPAMGYFKGTPAAATPDAGPK